MRAFRLPLTSVRVCSYLVPTDVGFINQALNIGLMCFSGLVFNLFSGVTTGPSAPSWPDQTCFPTLVPEPTNTWRSNTNACPTVCIHWGSDPFLPVSAAANMRGCGVPAFYRFQESVIADGATCVKNDDPAVRKNVCPLVRCGCSSDVSGIVVPDSGVFSLLVTRYARRPFTFQWLSRSFFSSPLEGGAGKRGFNR